ncbi:MAG: GNAT family N-acetyltransferase [Thermoguttaceae bacterium]|nr:GNAT family N-acetyltransferase [Thermoguttaceae bacterium]
MTRIWQSRAGQPGLAQPVSPDLFEEYVFGKLHFDYGGLIFALEDDCPAGFVHAAFGPDAARHWIAPETGVIAMLQACPGDSEHEIARALVVEAEAYLRTRGAKVVYGGCVQPHNPFYMGLYGGADLPGVLDTDTVFQEALRANGYQPVRQIAVLRRALHDFQPPADRQQVQYRRRMLVQVIVDPPARNRWEALTTGDFDLTRFELVPRGSGQTAAYLVVRDMAIGNHAAGRTVGVVELEVDPAERRKGLATCLLSETFRMLAGQGFDTVEMNIPADDAIGMRLAEKLGFCETCRGTLFRKEW